MNKLGSGSDDLNNRADAPVDLQAVMKNKSIDNFTRK